MGSLVVTYFYTQNFSRIFSQPSMNLFMFFNDRDTYWKGGSVAEWLACWTQAQKGAGLYRSRDAVG